MVAVAWLARDGGDYGGAWRQTQHGDVGRVGARRQLRCARIFQICVQGMAQNVPSKSVKMPMDSADWNDYNTRVVCEIFVDQVAAGNCPNTHLSNPGYDEVIEKFVARTGLRYTRLQIKNKWDKLRVEHNCWKKLISQTGLGWDNTKETVAAIAERWKQLKADIPGCSKFMRTGLQNEELLQKIFEDICNTGADHWSLGQRTIPTPTNEAIHIVNHNEIDEEMEEDEPSAKRKRGGGSKVDKSKKTKSGSQKMVEEMSKSNELSAQTLSSIQSFTKIREDPPGCSIKDVMALVEECGVVERTDEHFIATEIFIKKEQREMFVNSLRTPVGRFAWLKKKYDVKYEN